MCDPLDIPRTNIQQLAEQFDYFIFDCDGVLVDSEPIAEGVMVEMVQEVDASITREAVITAYKHGGSLEDSYHYIRDVMKVAVADTLHKAADTAIQLCGAKGYSRDTPLEWIYRYARQARLVDGASEVHKMVLSRNLMALGQDFWSWG